MDLLSQDDLSGGYVIAGTGTIEASGSVGSIGGIRQKVVAATEAGADYILVPSGNYEDAQTVETDVPLIEISSLEGALDFLRSLKPKN
jgi:PDZ domain-containing protein